MGIDVHGLNLLSYSLKRKKFGRVLTIGRQGLHVPRDRLSELIPSIQESDLGPYCEALLKAHFGATEVDSIDNSEYEGATIVADMNKPIEPSIGYDTIIDGGCLEHIYNVPQALRNVSSLCADGGQIIHVLPANNFCGHGFWQFSPELFFSLYCEVNGYRDTQVFLADLKRERIWYEVIRPQNGERANASSRSSVYVLVRTVKVGQVSHENIQQSDYIYTWSNQAGNSVANRGKYVELKRFIKESPLGPVALAVYRVVRNRNGLSSRNPHLAIRRVSELLA